MAHGLDGIAVVGDSCLRTYFLYLLDGLYGAYFIVSPLHGNESGVIRHCGTEIIKMQKSLTVHGQELDPGRLHLPEHQRPGGNHHLLVGQGDVAPGPDGGQRGGQPHRPHQGRDHQLGLVGGHGLQALGPGDDLGRDVAELRPQRLGPRRLGHRHQLRAEAAHLLGQLVEVAPGGERAHPVALGERLDHVEGLLADAPRAAEERDGPRPRAHRPTPEPGRW